MDTPPVDAVTDLLFGKTRRAVLGLLFTRPDESFHLREVARLSGAPLGPVQREVAALTAAGLLIREPRGRQVFYRLDSRCPVFNELKSLVLKTAGLVDLLRQALAPLAGSLRVAFVFGSFARGEHGHASDVDLLVIGKVTFADLAAALRVTQARLGRVVNPTVYSPDEFRRKRDAGNHFLSRVIAGPKLFVVGGEDDLAAMATERMAEAARPEPAGNRRPVRRHRARSGRK
jgi:predicted nucleotidyltransferase